MSNTWTAFQKERVEGREEGVPWYVGDKLAAYNFAETLGVKTPRIYNLYDAPEKFEDAGYPDQFVVKPTGLHSTKGVMVLRRTASGLYHDSMRRRDLTADDVRKEQTQLFIDNKFKKNYKLIVEEKLIDEDGTSQIPYDYKLYTFGGDCEFIVQIDRNTSPPGNAWFGPDWSEFDVEANLESDWKTIQRSAALRPACADEMLAVASKISVALKTAFVSVDLYATNRGAVLGELTLAPGGPYYGTMYRFKPRFDAQLGDKWKTVLETASPA